MPVCWTRSGTELKIGYDEALKLMEKDGGQQRVGSVIPATLQIPYAIIR